jgi:hypothetical protein
LAQFRSSKAFRNALRNEQREIDEQASITTTPASELQQLVADQDSQAELRNRLVQELSDLRRSSKSKGSEGVVCSRAFLQLWIQGIETGQEEFRNKLFSQAALYFDLMAEANPDQSWPLVLLAEAQTRAGNKKTALKALEEATKRGLKNPQALAQDPELQALTSEPAFQRIVHEATSK